jgi:IclR family KDG regulon transcriptional repressor
MSKPIRQSDRHVDAVMAALSLLDCFLDAPQLTLKQLADKTGFTRNRVTRLTGTLVHRDYLLVTPSTGAFTPGPRLMSLGRVFEGNRSLVGLARPILQALALKTGESVSLYGREGLERVVLAREEGTQAIRFTVSEGQRMDLHTGASGKVLLAFAPPGVLEALLSGPGLVRRTARTIDEPRRLRDEIARVKQQGYAESMGERVEDARALAVPVFGSGGTLVAALGIAGPVSRFTAEIRDTYRLQLQEAAAVMGRQMGCRSDGPGDAGGPGGTVPEP